MQQSYWQLALVGLVLLGGGSSAGYAEDAISAAKAPAAVSVTGSHWHRGRPSGSGGQGGFGFAASLDRKLGLTPEQKDSVRGLLAQQHQQSAALREETDQKIRVLLSSEQQKKFDAMLAEQKTRRSHPSERS